jgi:predicted Zn-dependent protease
VRHILALATLALACSAQQRRSAELEAANVLVPPGQEKQLGEQVKQELEQKQKVRYVEDPAVNAYVKGITDKILAFAKKDRPDVTWSVKVIDDPKTVNAFATPGGYLYVYSGLLLAAANSAEVAGVLGHESGHVVARHSARQMVDQMGLETVAEMALGRNPGAVSKMAASLVGSGTMLAYSRADESEADEYGARYASMAGYDPHGLVTFFEKLARSEGKQPAYAKFLSDHPATPDRIEQVKQYIADHHLGGSGGTSGTEIAAVQAKLRALPQPPAAPQQAEQGQPSPPTGTGGQ